MSETLYLKIDRNIVVHKPQVTLKDIAKLSCTAPEIEHKLNTMKIYTFQAGKGKQPKQLIQVVSVLKVIEQINQAYPSMEIQNLGEIDFVLEYIPRQEAKWWSDIKAWIICILIFFGSAFTIMTFNNDVGVSDVFAKLYQQVMGSPSDGFTPLELFYSLGIGIGILVFFNHVGRKKVTHDPTPMQVQMRKYEQDVDTTFIENSSRKGTSIDVD